MRAVLTLGEDLKVFHRGGASLLLIGDNCGQILRARNTRHNHRMRRERTRHRREGRQRMEGDKKKTKMLNRKKKKNCTMIKEKVKNFDAKLICSSACLNDK